MVSRQRRLVDGSRGQYQQPKNAARKHMKASIFCLPSIGSRAEIEAGMAATRPELYQRMLKELTELVKLADDLGYDSVSFTEHHFHIEGFEAVSYTHLTLP